MKAALVQPPGAEMEISESFESEGVYSFLIDSVTIGNAFAEINKNRIVNLFINYLKKAGAFKIYINNMTYVDKNAKRRDNEKTDTFFVDLHFLKNRRVFGINT